MEPGNCTIELMKLRNCSAIARSCSHIQSVPLVTIVLLVLSVILFILLLLRDGVKGLKGKANWIPGDFLVLSALTIELLNLISTQGQPLNWQKRDILLVEFWMIHTSRIMLCVVIAYLMPAMANPGAEDFWGKITSLALTVFLHVISELYIIKPDSATDILKSLWPRQQGTSLPLYYVLAAIIFTSFVLLLLLLASANIAGRGIERIIADRVPLILKGQVKGDHQQHSDEDAIHCDECWQRVEDSVLRAWIISRAYSLEYVIARSPLAASAATIVTLQIAITLVAGVRNSPKLLMCTALDWLRFYITMLQCVFILIGWSMILWRWITAVVYYENPSSGFRREDFWTRHLKELQEAKQNELPQAQLLDAKVEKLVVNQSTKLSLHRYVLYVVIWVQLFMVFFSKACWLTSLKISHNRLMGMLLSRVLLKLKKGCPDHINEILEGVQMLGETPESLWLSNRLSIPVAADLISQGERAGQGNCKHLVDFVVAKRTDPGLGLSCLDPSKPRKELKYVCRRSTIEEEAQMTDMGRKQWKMTAVTQLSIIVQLSPICAQPDPEQPSTSQLIPPKVVKDCMDAYSQAWEIIDFVDRAEYSYTEDGGISREAADGVTSEAADKFYSTALKKGVVPFRYSGEAKAPDNVTETLGPLKKDCKSKTETPGSINENHGLKDKEKPEGCSNRSGSDSTDSKETAWRKAVYKLCNSIDCNEDTNVNDLLTELESCFANIINECLKKTQRLLLLNCRKWALDNGERKIAAALHTTGKARAIMMMLCATQTR